MYIHSRKMTTQLDNVKNMEFVKHFLTPLTKTIKPRNIVPVLT